MTTTATIRALATAFPAAVRTNDHWRERVPELLNALQRKASSQIWEADEAAQDPWTASMRPYLDDVFRGSVTRRVLGPGERALDLELRAARRCLDAAGMAPADLDLALVTSFFPDQLVVGNGVHLAQALGVQCPFWNVESACGSALADLLLAVAMVESGRARNVLLVLSCAYSRALPDDSPMSWTSGDGAAALLVTAGGDGASVLGSRVVATPETIPALTWSIRPDDTVGFTPTFAGTREAAALIARSTNTHVAACADAALAASGMTRADIDFAVFPTPTAWFVDFGRRVLGLGAEQTIDTYPELTNTGPVLSPQNLYFAARGGRLHPGDRVLFVAQGSQSSCGALVLRWGDVAVATECEL